MRVFHPNNLYAERAEGELEYTPLQLTRLRRSHVRFQTVVMGALVAVVAAGLVAVAWAWQNDNKLQDALDEIVAVRDESRLAECRRDNKQSDNAVAYARNQAQVLVDASQRGREVPTADKARADAYVTAAEESARRLFPKRSCTPAAIAAHYESDR